MKHKQKFLAFIPIVILIIFLLWRWNAHRLQQQSIAWVKSHNGFVEFHEEQSNNFVNKVYSWFNPTSVKKVSISTINLTDIEKLINFPNLESLVIKSDSIETKCTLKNISPLSSLHSLKSIHFSILEVSDLNPIKNLQKLEYLHLYNCSIEDISPIKNLSTIKFLYLYGTQIKEVEALKDFQNLEVLFLGRTQVKDLRPLSEIKNLRDLDLKSTPIESLLSLSNMPNLQFLNLENTSITTIQIKEFQRLSPNCKVNY